MIDLNKLRRKILANKRPKIRPTPPSLEIGWVSYVERYVAGQERAAWAVVEPVLRSILPVTFDKRFGLAYSGTVDTSLVDALELSRQRFLNLDSLKSRADTIFTKVDNLNRLAFRAMLKRATGVGLDDLLDSEKSRLAVTNSIDESIDLIKTVNSEHFEIFKRNILQGVTNGTDFHSLKKLVLDAAEEGYPKWKATRIARDQYGKLNGRINEVRQGSIGVTHYFWRSSGDNRVRDSHRDRDGERFAWNDPPPDGHPGHPIQCRCVADPDLSTAMPKLIGSASWQSISEERFGPRVGG